MNKFFELIIRHASPDTGKYKNYSYVVEAINYSEAEANGYKIIMANTLKDASIERITKLEIENVYKRDLDEPSDCEDNFYCQIKSIQVGIDERSGKEVVIEKHQHLVLTSDFPSVVEFIIGTFGSTEDIRIMSQKMTNVYCVYFRDELSDMPSPDLAAEADVVTETGI